MRYYSWTGKFEDGTGTTTIPHLTAAKLKRIAFAFPPREQQQQIAEILGKVHAAVKCLGDRAERSRDLTKTLVVNLLSQSGVNDVHRS
jgi:restriction endonuclease S subunit